MGQAADLVDPSGGGQQGVQFVPYCAEARDVLGHQFGGEFGVGHLLR